MLSFVIPAKAGTRFSIFVAERKNGIPGFAAACPGLESGGGPE